MFFQLLSYQEHVHSLVGYSAALPGSGGGKGVPGSQQMFDLLQTVALQQRDEFPGLGGKEGCDLIFLNEDLLMALL